MKMPYRCRWDKKLAGVCGGLGQYFRIDPTLIRLAFVLLLFPAFLLPIIIYLLCWALFPLGPTVYIDTGVKKLYKSKRNRVLAGICGGVGEYLKIDPIVVRVIFLVLIPITAFFPLLLSYIVGAVVIPDRKI